ncbi:MAG: butyrate kinase [Clostridiales bacterium]|jgi:butyrate kinase|nr:butyrate kinase [Clostridiales bacterium]
MYKIVAINLGSTSTKICYYEDNRCVLKTNLAHSAAELASYASIWDQEEYRTNAIMAFLNENNITLSDLDAVVSRGGHTKPLTGGVYRITKKMLDESGSGVYGVHATDLGLRIAYKFSRQGPRPMTVDPPTTDEFEPLARYSGLPELPRRSSFHALNHRAVGKQYARDNGLDYNQLNLIVAHMGGGITVAAHKQGKMVDANNGINGDGPFSTNRCGSVPVSALVDMCYSGKYTLFKMKRRMNNSGMMAYLGESDVLTVERRAADGDEKCREVLEAMCYQCAKEISACAAVLYGKVDAILITGGMANSELLTSLIRERVEFIAPVVLYPGEHEMQSLCLNAYEALKGLQPTLEID